MGAKPSMPNCILPVLCEGSQFKADWLISRCRIGGIMETETPVSLQNWRYKGG